MSQNKAGDIVGIRDWSNRYFYNRDEIADFFIRSNQSGLKAYAFTIVGPTSTSIAITESASTNPQSYTVETDETGIFSGLFFFHTGSTLTLTPSGYSPTTYVLDEYSDTIYCSGYQIVKLIPQMSSMSASAGNVIHYKFRGNRFPADGYGNVNTVYFAFDRMLVDCGNIGEENITDGWIGFEFTTPVARLYSIKGELGNYLPNNSFRCKYQYYKNNDWHDFGNVFTVSGYNGASTEPEPYTHDTFEETGYVENVEKIRLIILDNKTKGTNVLVLDLQAYGVQTIGA